MTEVPTWGPEQQQMLISSLSFAQKPVQRPCDTNAGFEINPLDPKSCIKGCREGYDAIGEVCALKCPTDLGYSTTTIANQCVPPKYKPKLLPGVNK